MDARWTKKNGVSYYGYKYHVKCDSASTLITDYEVTSANVHDSQVLFDLIDESCKGEALFAHSAYAGEGFAERLEGLEVETTYTRKATRIDP